MKELVILLIPLISMIVGSFSPSNNKYYRIIKVQPPGYVFGIAWLILYTLIGLSYYFNIVEQDSELEYHILYPLLLIVLYSWSWVFNKNPKILYTLY